MTSAKPPAPRPSELPGPSGTTKPIRKDAPMSVQHDQEDQQGRVGPFVTFVERARPDGAVARWDSRRHRKHPREPRLPGRPGGHPGPGAGGSPSCSPSGRCRSRSALPHQGDGGPPQGRDVRARSARRTWGRLLASKHGPLEFGAEPAGGQLLRQSPGSRGEPPRGQVNGVELLFHARRHRFWMQPPDPGACVFQDRAASAPGCATRPLPDPHRPFGGFGMNGRSWSPPLLTTP